MLVGSIVFSFFRRLLGHDVTARVFMHRLQTKEGTFILSCRCFYSLAFLEVDEAVKNSQVAACERQEEEVVRL